ncbi:MAG: MurR/RpiR family transcriptional regulator [Glaciimonas sp.]|nr:MurR/RpiR family transcriptional regulator [Glaciimonas sp.]
MTLITQDPIGLIRDSLATLPRALKQVGLLVSEDAEWVLRANVEDIAQRAGVSPPTIIRFCRHIGYAGLRDFKLILAQRLAVGVPHFQHNTASKNAQGEPHTLLQTIATDTAQLLNEWASHYSPEPLERAINALAGAHKIDCYGIGNTSVFLANDAQARFFRLGINSHAYFDPHMQLYSAATLSKNDVLLAISHVGRQQSLLEAVDVAKKGGATIIAITQNNTPLAQLADVVLPIVIPEDPSVRLGMESYTAQLLLLETLVVGISMQLGQATINQPERFRLMLEERKSTK